MKLVLEYDDVHFGIARSKNHGQYRYLMVTIDGKPFSVWRTVDSFEVERGEHYMRHIDEMLAAQMEIMLKKIFSDACAAIPEGTPLLKE
jgi:hypothetical protein